MSSKEAQEISHKHTPIGVFWDIENVRVPRGKSASALVYALRNKFFNGRKEVEFLCVCDINKERKEIIEELNDAQVTVVHINATSKNAADDKIKQSLRRFADTFPPPANVVLISGDTNFTTELSDLRHRHKLHVILVHLKHTQEALIACANESYLYEDIVKDIPDRGAMKSLPRNGSSELLVTNLPSLNKGNVQLRLKQLSDNCGGKVTSVEKGSAMIKFPNSAAAARAKKRMAGEDVFGSSIMLSYYENGLSQQQEDLSLSDVETTTNTGCFFNGSHSRSKSCDRESYSSSELNFLPEKMQGGNPYGNPEKVEYTWPSHEYMPSSERSTPSPSTLRHPRPSTTSKFFRDGAGSPFGQGRFSPLLHSRCGDGNPNYRSGTQDGWHSAPTFSPQQNRHPGPDGYRKTPGANRPTNRREPTMNYGNMKPRTDYFSPVPSPPFCSNEDDYKSHESEGSNHSWSTGSGECSQLVVTNLDYNISAKEWKSILASEFNQSLNVNVSAEDVFVQSQSDNTSIAYIRMQSMSDARYAISQFHRKKIGYKRIHVALVGTEDQDAILTAKYEVRMLLQELNDRPVPLFKFIDLFEKKYGRKISLSDLFKMKDVLEIKDQDSSGRMIFPISTFNSAPPQEEIMETLICPIHGQLGLANNSDSVILPNVILSLKTFSSRLHKLLMSHNESLPLISFQACYEAEISKISPVDDGVSLEHLISCVPGVKIVKLNSGSKQIHFTEQSTRSSPTEHIRSSTSLLLSDKLHQFTKDVIELLKNCPQCILHFGKFVPEYHHHFGRQCRVYDYGFSKLLELFEAIPHIVQIIGSGSKKFITLSHKAQVKRFTTDLLKMLRSQASKRINIKDFVIIYKNIIGKPFDIKDYGVCFIEDMLSEIPENFVSKEGSEMELDIFIPRREQSPEEVEKTRQFVYEVIDLLKHSPNCKMMFNKFIPAYHHHFGKQCKVSEYGFSKLVELFEAIPHAVNMTENGEEKVLSLTEPELLRVLEEQVITLLKLKNPPVLPVPEFLTAFNKLHGHSINLGDYNVKSVMELIEKIPEAATVEQRNGKLFIVMVDKSALHTLICNVLKTLMDEDEGCMTVAELQEVCGSKYGQPVRVTELKHELNKYVEVTEKEEVGDSIVQLLPLQLFARDARNLLKANLGKVSLSQFEETYREHFKTTLVPAIYGYPSVLALLEAVPLVIAIRGKGYRRTVLVCKDFQEPIEILPSASPISNGNDTLSDSCIDQNTKYLQNENDSGIDPNCRFQNDSGIGPNGDIVNELNQKVINGQTGGSTLTEVLKNAARYLPKCERQPSTEDSAIIYERTTAPNLGDSAVCMHGDMSICNTESDPQYNYSSYAPPQNCFENTGGAFQMQPLVQSMVQHIPPKDPIHYPAPGYYVATQQHAVPNMGTTNIPPFGNPLPMCTPQENVPDSGATQKGLGVELAEASIEASLNNMHLGTEQAPSAQMCDTLNTSVQVGTPRRSRLAAKFNNPQSLD